MPTPPSKRIPPPKPKTCEFADINLRTLRWQEYPELAMWAQCTYKNWKREAEGPKRDVIVEGHSDDTMLPLKVDKGGRESRNADSLFESHGE